MADLLGDFLEFLGGLRLVGKRAARELVGDGLGQVFRDEPLDHVSLAIHDAVDSEVQVRAVELEELTEEQLESLGIRFHVYPLMFSIGQLIVAVHARRLRRRVQRPVGTIGENLQPLPADKVSPR